MAPHQVKEPVETTQEVTVEVPTVVMVPTNVTVPIVTQVATEIEEPT